MDSMGAKEMTDKLLIERELLERLVGNGPTSTLSATRELREILAATRQLEGEEIAWSLRSDVAGCGLVRYMTDRKYQAQTPAIKQWYEPYRCQQCCDANRAIAELREVNRIQLEIATVHGAACVEIRKQRDKLAELLRMVRQDGWYRLRQAHEITQIDAALAEVAKEKDDEESEAN